MIRVKCLHECFISHNSCCLINQLQDGKGKAACKLQLEKVIHPAANTHFGVGGVTREYHLHLQSYTCMALHRKKQVYI